MLYRQLKEEYDAIYAHHQKVKGNKGFLHDQLNKYKTTHTELLPKIMSPPSDDRAVAEDAIDYIGLAKAAGSFKGQIYNDGEQEDCEEDPLPERFTVKLVPELKEALLDHIQDLHSFKVLSDRLRGFAVELIEAEDMYAVFAFYKFADHDASLVTYLKQRDGTSVEEQNIARKKQEKNFRTRSKSIKMFMDEREIIYKLLREEAEERKRRERLAAEEEAQLNAAQKKTKKKKKKKGKKKRPKPRWMKMYEDATKKQRRASATEPKEKFGVALLTRSGHCY